MNEKTDVSISASEIPSHSLISLTFLAVLMLLLVVPQTLIERNEPRKRIMFERGLVFLQFPHVVAAGITIANGLEEFSGKTPDAMEPRMSSLIALGILTAYVVGPALFFSSLRRRFCGERSRLPRGSSVLGVLTAGLWMALVIPMVVIQLSVRSSIRHAQSVESAKDDIINSMSDIKIVAMDYRILPRTLSGGGGSFVGFTLPARLRETQVARFDIYPTNDEIRIVAHPTTNPMSRFTDEPLLPVPTASVEAKLNAKGFLTDWEYLGLFE